MDKLISVTAIAAPLPLVNVDTDMIVPQQFLKTIKKSGLGEIAFYNLRYSEGGKKKQDFILNQPPYDTAQILITGSNFGCGSSREHAPWALKDFGIRVIIASRFADIFYGNCLKNGILPVILDEEQVQQLLNLVKKPEDSKVTVDLEKQQVVDSKGNSFDFPLDEFRKYCLLNGLDEISLTLQQEASISQFENRQKEIFPWLG